MRSTMDAIYEHRERVLGHYAESQLLGVFLYGSQNYGINTTKSDVDTKAIIVPNMKDLVLDKPVSRELQFSNGEHCEMKDIREIVKMFSKQNINFVEILFTEYSWVNPKYNHIWKKYFVNNAEKIAHMNPRYTINSICGQAINTLRRNPGDGKAYANGVRLYSFLKNYLKGVPYKTCININSQSENFANRLIGYKLGSIKPDSYDVEELIEKFRTLEEDAGFYPNTPNPEAVDIMKDGLMALITNERNDFDFYKLKAADPCETCGMAYGSNYCIKYCPHESK